MTIKNDGNVGIGTTTPISKLSIVNGTTTAGFLSSYSDYFEIGSNGFVTLKGSARAWEDLRFPATDINPAGAVGPMTFDTTNIGFTASASATTSIAVIAQLPHSWAEGTDIHPHIHWEPTTTDTGNVLWTIAYRWTNIDGTEPGWTFINVLDAGDGTAFKHQFIDLPSISGSGKTVSSILSIIVSRSGANSQDTYADDALLKEFDIHYQVDGFGSRTELTK